MESADIDMLKNTLFRTVLILIVKSDIIFIVTALTGKLDFYLKFTKLEKMTHFRPALRTETYQSIQTRLRVLALRSIPGVQMGWFQLSDVTAAPCAHMSDVTFSKF